MPSERKSLFTAVVLAAVLWPLVSVSLDGRLPTLCEVHISDFSIPFSLRDVTLRAPVLSTQPPLSQAQIDAVTEGAESGKLRESAFAMLYYVDQLPFHEALDAARAIRQDGMSYDRYLAFRRGFLEAHAEAMVSARDMEKAAPTSARKTRIVPPPPRYTSAAMLRDLRDVGQHRKALGYLPEDDVAAAGTTTSALRLELSERGISTLVRDGTLVAFDPDALGKLLRQHEAIVRAAGWPTTPDAFAERVVTEIVPSDGDLYAVVALAFNDSRTLAQWALARAHGAMPMLLVPR
jgi:hypothetical protein